MTSGSADISAKASRSASDQPRRRRRGVSTRGTRAAATRRLYAHGITLTSSEVAPEKFSGAEPLSLARSPSSAAPTPRPEADRRHASELELPRLHRRHLERRPGEREDRRCLHGRKERRLQHLRGAQPQAGENRLLVAAAARKGERSRAILPLVVRGSQRPPRSRLLRPHLRSE